MMEAKQNVEPAALLEPFKYRPPSAIPRREFLYDGHFIRGYVSATVAPGGAGKSAKAIVEALAMATGKPLLGVMPKGRFRVGYWNGEDPAEETERRVAAAIVHYGLDGRDLEGWFFSGSGRDVGLTIAEQTRDGAKICVADIDRLNAAFSSCRLDAAIIDPFVSAHNVPENDNGAIDLAVKAFGRVTDRHNAALDLVHHTRKGTGPEHHNTVEDGRGAGALLFGVRSSRVLNTMTTDQAAKAGVEERSRRRFFSVENGKANLTPPPSGADWFEIVSVDLGNGPGPNGEGGDNVGVVTAWAWPDPFANVSGNDAYRVQQAVDGGEWREDKQAREWVGYAVAGALSLDIGREDKASRTTSQVRARAKVAGLIKAWLASGVLVVEEGKDAKRNPRKFVVVGQWVIP